MDDFDNANQIVSVEQINTIEEELVNLKAICQLNNQRMQVQQAKNEKKILKMKAQVFSRAIKTD